MTTWDQVTPKKNANVVKSSCFRLHKQDHFPKHIPEPDWKACMLCVQISGERKWQEIEVASFVAEISTRDEEHFLNKGFIVSYLYHHPYTIIGVWHTCDRCKFCNRRTVTCAGKIDRINPAWRRKKDRLSPQCRWWLYRPFLQFKGRHSPQIFHCLHTPSPSFHWSKDSPFLTFKSSSQSSPTHCNFCRVACNRWS